MKIKESREELSKLLSTPQKYLSRCPFCGKETIDHTLEDMDICVTKKLIAQGILPEHFDSEKLFR